MICGSAWREDVSRADVLKILSNILESMEDRERKNNAAVNIREKGLEDFCIGGQLRPEDIKKD